MVEFDDINNFADKLTLWTIHAIPKPVLDCIHIYVSSCSTLLWTDCLIIIQSFSCGNINQ